jgi:hypothetical protein
MTRTTRRPVLQRLRLWSTVAVVAAAACLSGCLSNEYVIPANELARIVELPPQSRGQQVRVVQEIGQRRSDPGPAAWPPADDPPVDVALDVGYSGGYGGGGPGPAYGPGSRPLPPRPRGEGRGPTSSWRGGGHGTSGGGGGGGGKDDLVVVALILMALATVSVVALSATEGSRYDGGAQIAPGQPVHLKDSYGEERVVPLGALSRGDLAGLSSAVVMDDEAYGLRLLGRAPLDRHGLTLKMDVGGLGTRVAGEAVDGLAGDIVIGGFPHQKVGVLALVSLGGGTDSLGRTFIRHGLGLEVETFPLALGRLHVGPFAHGGVQIIAEPGQPTTTAPAAGGGLMLELDLTTRLALYGRADVTTARFAGDDWRTTGLVTAGLAIY